MATYPQLTTPKTAAATKTTFIYYLLRNLESDDFHTKEILNNYLIIFLLRALSVASQGERSSRFFFSGFERSFAVVSCWRGRLHISLSRWWWLLA